MKCPICHDDYVDGDRVQVNIAEEIIWKPASVPDVKVFRKNSAGQEMEVSAAAVLSPEELAETRKDHKKTVIATTFFVWGKVPVPEGAMNMRHVGCVVQRTAQNAPIGIHARNKHWMRHQRSVLRKQ